MAKSVEGAERRSYRTKGEAEEFEKWAVWHSLRSQEL
jgi:hypothetical protein